MHGHTSTTLFLSETDKYNQNQVDIGSNLLNTVLVKLLMRVLRGLWITNTVYENTYVTLTIMSPSPVSKTGFLTYEVFWGETPDIYMISFKL